MSVRAMVSLLILSASASASEPPPIEHNPFSRPPTEVRVQDGQREMSRPTTELVLTATMVSSAERLAHIDGRVVREGEQIYGYQLLRIYEDRAIFERNGNTETVYVKPERDENDEPETRR